MTGGVDPKDMPKGWTKPNVRPGVIRDAAARVAARQIMTWFPEEMR